MDIQQLVAALTACTNPDANIRRAGEDAVKQQHLVPGGLVNLLRVAVEETMEFMVRQVAAIAFKNAVKKDWEHRESRPSKISEEEKLAVRPLVLEGVVRCPQAVRVQLEEALKQIISWDYPQRWPDLVPVLASSLTSGDQSLMCGSLRTLRIIARKYEFRDESERAPLISMIDTTFPSILAVFQTLIANPSPSPDLAELLKLCCKIFWSSCYLEIPPLMVREDQFTGWMSALLALAARAVPAEECPDDPVLRKQWPWWKAKKWVYHVAYRLFTRYGNPKRCGPQPDVAFATRWKNECSITFLGAVLNELSNVARGTWVAPRVSNILLQYVAEAVNHIETWKTLKPHVQGIVEHAVMPLLSFDEEDAELWEDDPHEYVRKGYDLIEDIYSSKTAAMSVIDALCNSRKKTQLDPIMAHIVSVMGECAPSVGDVNNIAAARRLDGALLSVGTLAERLKKENRYKTQLEPMLQQHVVPLFASPHGHLRSKGCWLAGLYADTMFTEGQGRGATFSSLLQCVITSLSDPQLPVRVDAGVAIRAFVDAVEEDDLGPVRPLVPNLLEKFLAISHEVDSEDLTGSLETVVERFGSDMGPYAVGVVTALTQQFWRAVAEEESGGGGDNESGGGGSNVNSFSDGAALAGYSILRAISTVLDAVSSLPELYPQLEELLFPILEKYSSEAGLDVFEEITQLITYLTYFAPAITPRMWTLFPRLLNCLDTWAIDYWSDTLLPLDNFISRGTEIFLTAPAASVVPATAGHAPVLLLDMTNRTLEKALTRKEKSGNGTTNGGLNDDDSWEGTESLNEAVVCASQLMSVILQNCRGRVDHCIAPYIALLTGQLHGAAASAGVSGEEIERDVVDALLVTGADALYYSPALTLSALSSSGTLPLFMGTLAKAIGTKRQNGSMKHFRGKREKKVIILGLTAVLGINSPQLPQGIGETLGQVTAAIVQLLIALKQQEDNKAGKIGIRDEDNGDGSESGSGSDGLSRFGVIGGASGNESDDEEEDEDGNDLSEEKIQRMIEASARRAGHGNLDNWDSDDEYWSEEDAEDEIGSPIDEISPFVFFAETVQSIQSTDPVTFSAITRDAAMVNVIQGMMAYATEIKQAQMAKAAAAASQQQ